MVEQGFVLHDCCVVGFGELEHKDSVTFIHSSSLHSTGLDCVHHPHVLSHTPNVHANQVYILTGLTVCSVHACVLQASTAVGFVSNGQKASPTTAQF